MLPHTRERACNTKMEAIRGEREKKRRVFTVGVDGNGRPEERAGCRKASLQTPAQRTLLCNRLEKMMCQEKKEKERRGRSLYLNNQEV